MPKKTLPRTAKDFWSNARVAVIGGGSWGTVLANLAARNCLEVRLSVRTEEHARGINATRANARYAPELQLHERVHALQGWGRVFEGGVQAVLWALPSGACREEARAAAPHFTGEEIFLHATKGIVENGDGTLKRVSEILREELPCPRIGVISGPNLAGEILRGEPAATVVASTYHEVIDAGERLLAGGGFRIYRSEDVVGVEWAGALKNILAIAAGALDALKLGWNARAMLITLGLQEMVRFGTELGARESTFLSLAGVGDLLATCSSPLSRNYRVGQRLALGEKLVTVLEDLGSTAEGVRTTRSVWEFASARGIAMPITQAVYRLLNEQVPARDLLRTLMEAPPADPWQ